MSAGRYVRASRSADHRPCGQRRCGHAQQRGDIRPAERPGDGLDGSTIGASVTGPTGSLDLTMNLSLNPRSRHAHRPALGERSAMSLTSGHTPAPLRATATRLLHGLVRRRRHRDADAAAVTSIGGGTPCTSPRRWSTSSRQAGSPVTGGMVPRRGQVAGGRRTARVAAPSWWPTAPKANRPAGRTRLLLAPRAAPRARRAGARGRRRLRARRAVVYVPAASMPTRRGGGGRAPRVRTRPDAHRTRRVARHLHRRSGVGRRQCAQRARRRRALLRRADESIRERGVRGPSHTGAERRDARPCGPRSPASELTGSGRSGTAQNPGTMLLTVHRPSGPTWSSRRRSALPSARRPALGDDERPGRRGVLLGGYGGAWVSPQVFAELPVRPRRRPGASARRSAPAYRAVLPRGVCPLAETADVVRYMEGQGAGQCGPCVHGLADAGRSPWSGWPTAGARRTPPDRILEMCTPGGRQGRLPAPRRRRPVRAQRPRRVRRRGGHRTSARGPAAGRGRRRVLAGGGTERRGEDWSSRA